MPFILAVAIYLPTYSKAYDLGLNNTSYRKASEPSVCLRFLLSHQLCSFFEFPLQRRRAPEVHGSDVIKVRHKGVPNMVAAARAR